MPTTSLEHPPRKNRPSQGVRGGAYQKVPGGTRQPFEEHHRVVRRPPDFGKVAEEGSGRSESCSEGEFAGVFLGVRRNMARSGHRHPRIPRLCRSQAARKSLSQSRCSSNVTDRCHGQDGQEKQRGSCYRRESCKGKGDRYCPADAETPSHIFVANRQSHFSAGEI